MNERTPLEYTKKAFLLRALIGGLCGLLVMLAITFLANSLSILGSTPDYTDLVLVSHGAQERFGSYALAVVGQSLLVFALGAAAGVSTLPFAEDGKALVLRSLLHFGVTGTLYALLLVLCLDIPINLLPVWLGILAALYLVIWLGRYVGWYVELVQIRRSLGLRPGSSVLHWRETLPYLPVLVLLCDVLPLLARLCDPADVPVLSGLVLPFLLLPLGSFFSGASLGKRQSFCPLYPVLAFVLYLPMVFLLYNASAMFHCCVAACASLLGNLLAAAIRRRRKKVP